MRLLSWTVLSVAAFVMGRAALSLPILGDPAAPAAVHVSPRYIEQGPTETGAPNMVTGVLADYRSFDTLGETVVVLAAGLACVLLLSRAPERDDDGEFL
jgi:multicomponent Na+:H+ antiporter subunit B